MHRLNQAFFVTVLLLTLLGSVAAADFTQTLGNAESAGLIKDQIRTELLEADVVDERFVLTVRIHNPSQFSLDLNGAYTVVSKNDDRITYGTIVNHEEVPSTVPARGSVTVTYGFALSPDQAERLRKALRRGPVNVSGQHSLQFHETKFSASFSGEVGRS